MNTKKFLHYIVIGGLFLIPLTPLLVVDSFFFPFITGKAYYFRILVEIIAAAWIILAALDTKYRPRFTSLTVAVTLFTLIALIADLFGAAPIKAIWSNFERMEGWILIAHLWLYFIVMSSTFIERKWWTWWLNTTLAVSMVTALIGFGQLAGVAEIHQGSDRIDATLGNSAYLAVYALIHIFIAGYLGVIKRKNIVINYLYWAAALVNLTVLYNTQTRGTLVGFVFGAFVSLLVYGLASTIVQKKLTRSSLITLSLCVLMVIGGGTFWSIRDSDFVKNNKVFNRFSSANLFNKVTQGRAYIWPMAIEGFKEKPILGWGQEGFNYVFNKYYDPHMWRHEQWFDRAHNVFLDWLIAGGLLGLLSYLSLYVFIVWIFVKSPRSLAEKSVLIGLVVAYAIHNIFVFDNISSYVLFFSILALAQFELTDHKKNLRIIGTNKPLTDETVAYVVGPIAVVVFVALLYFVNIRSIRANTTLIDALISCNQPTKGEVFAKVISIEDPTSQAEAREQLILCGDRIIRSKSPQDVRDGIYMLVQDEMAKHLTQFPNDARGYYFAATLHQAALNPVKSNEFIDKAIALSPEKQTIQFVKVLNHIQLGEFDSAAKLAEKIYNLDQGFNQAQFYYAIALIYNKRSAEADKIIALDPSFKESPQILQAYVNAKEYSRALPLFLEKIKKEPTNVAYRVSTAAIYMKQNQRTLAIAQLEEIAKLEPKLKPQVDTWIKDIRAGKNPVQD